MAFELATVWVPNSQLSSRRAIETYPSICAIGAPQTKPEGVGVVVDLLEEHMLVKDWRFGGEGEDHLLHLFGNSLEINAADRCVWDDERHDLESFCEFTI